MQSGTRGNSNQQFPTVFFYCCKNRNMLFSQRMYDWVQGKHVITCKNSFWLVLEDLIYLIFDMAFPPGFLHGYFAIAALHG